MKNNLIIITMKNKIIKMRREKCKSVTFYGKEHLRRLNEDLTSVSNNGNDKLEDNFPLQKIINRLNQEITPKEENKSKFSVVYF